MGRRELLLERVPAWVGLLVAWVVLVAGWAVVAPGQVSPPSGFVLLAIVPATVGVVRGAWVSWWRVVAWIAIFALTGLVVAPQISSLALWFVVVAALTVPSAYLLIDRAWSPPWRADH